MQRAIRRQTNDGPVHREAQAQRALFRWIRRQPRQVMPGLDLAFSTLNGAYLQGGPVQRKRRWRQLRAEGAKTGVADIFLPVPRSGFHGLWLEMKAPKPHNAAVTADQSAWLDAMRERGYRARVCYGETDAMAAILEYYGVYR